MKLTKDSLKQIIKEELDAVMEGTTMGAELRTGPQRIAGLKTTVNRIEKGAVYRSKNPKATETMAMIAKMPKKAYTRSTAMGEDFIYIRDEKGNVFFAANHGENRADSAEKELEAMGYTKV